MKAEKDIIVEISAKFACFLDKNSITPYNDAVKGHLDYLIREKEKLEEHEKVEELKQMLANYETQKEILKKSIKELDKGTTIITPEDAEALKQKLFDLEINGQTFKNICSNLQKIKEEYSYREVNVQPSNWKLKGRGTGGRYQERKSAESENNRLVKFFKGMVSTFSG